MAKPKPITDALLRLFESMTRSAVPRRVIAGRLAFPAGGLAKWLAKPVPYGDGKIRKLVGELRALTERGDAFVDLQVTGDTLDIRAWDWTQDESHEHELAKVLRAAAPLGATGDVRIFGRYDRGDTQWITYRFARGKLAIKESGDNDTFDWDADPRVATALAFVAPALDAWIASHPGMASRIQHAGRWGYVDRDGREVIPPTYTGASDFAEGRAFVSVGIAQTRVIDNTGRVLPGDWQYVRGGFQRGLAAIAVGERYGYIDRDGQLVIPTTYFSAEPFAGPLAAVKTVAWTATEQRFITPTGELVGDRFDYTLGFTGELAWIYANARGAWQAVDAQGRLVPALARGYYDVRPFYGGLAAVVEAAGEKFRYIDARGDTVIAPRFDEAYGFAGDRAVVKLDGAYRLIDREARVVGPPFEGFVATGVDAKGMTTGVVDGLVGVTIGGKVGFLDAAGNVAIAPRWDFAGPFRDGRAAVTVLARETGALTNGQIDREGRVVLEPSYDALGEYRDGRTMVKSGSRCGFVDAAGAVVVPLVYKQVAAAFHDGLAWVQLP